MKIVHIFQTIIGLLLIAAFVFPIYYFVNLEQEINHLYEPVTYRDLRHNVRCIGKIESGSSTKIKSTVTGIITDIYVKISDEIKVGTPIAKVEPIPDDNALLSLENEIALLEIQLKGQDKEKIRMENLLQSGIIAEKEFDDFITEYEILTNDIDLKKERYRLIEEGKLQNDGNTIFSTVEGIVSQVYVEKGSSVVGVNQFNAGAELIKVLDMGEMIFRGHINQSDISKIRKGMKGIIYDANNAEMSQGEITIIGVEAETKENGVIEFPIEAKVYKGNYRFSGLNITFDITIVERDSVLSIKESAIVDDSNGSFVYKDDSDSLREVRLGISDGIFVEIIEGVAMGDSVRIIY